VHSILHPQAPHSHSLPSLQCPLQLFPDHILTLLSLLSLDSPFSPFFNVFVPALLLFPSRCRQRQQQSAASSPVLCVSPPPAFTKLALQPPFLCCSGAWSSLAVPRPHSRRPITHRQRRQTAPTEFYHGFPGSQGFGCGSTCERRSIILHSRLGCTIKAQAQKQTLDVQIFSQDLLLLTQHPDYYTMSRSLCKPLLSGIEALLPSAQHLSSSLISTEVMFSPQCPPAEWKMAGTCRDVLEGLWDFDPLSSHAGARKKPPKGKRGRCAWYGMTNALMYPQIASEPVESPWNLQRCEETTLDLFSTSNALV